MGDPWLNYRPDTRGRPMTFHVEQRKNHVDPRDIEFKPPKSYWKPEDFRRPSYGMETNDRGLVRLASKDSKDSGVNSIQEFSEIEDRSRNGNIVGNTNVYDNNLRPLRCDNDRQNQRQNGERENFDQMRYHDESAGYVQPNNARQQNQNCYNPIYSDPYSHQQRGVGCATSLSEIDARNVSRSASQQAPRVHTNYRQSEAMRDRRTPIPPLPPRGNSESEKIRSGCRGKRYGLLLLVLAVGVGVGVGIFFLINYFKAKDDCEIMNIANGRMDNAGEIKKGDLLEVTCNSGFQQNMSEPVVCLATGAWSDAPECLRIKCQTVWDIDVKDGTLEIKNDEFRYEDEICVICGPLYTPVHERCMTCKADGTWSTKPRCRPRECPPFTVANGNVELKRNDAMVTCIVGYEIVGDFRVFCEIQTETWSHMPECHIVDCGPLPQIDHGQVYYNKTIYKARASVDCDTGNVPGDNDEAECLATGEWSSNLSCTPVNCGEYNPPRHAEIINISDSSMYGDWRTVRCEDGFAFTGDSDIPTRNTTCVANQTWTHISNCHVEGMVRILASEIWSIGQQASIVCMFELPMDWKTVFLEAYNTSNNLWTGQPNNISDAVVRVMEGVVHMTKTYVISEVDCNHEHIYACGIAAGDTQDEMKTSTQSVFVTEVIDKPGDLTMPNVVSLTDRVTIMCEGYLGKDDAGMKEGDIYILVKTNDSLDFLRMESERSDGLDGCRYSEVVKYTFNAEPESNGMQVKCATVRDGHRNLESDVATLSVIKVDIRTAPEDFFIVGEPANVTCTAFDVPTWRYLQIMRDSTAILTVYSNSTYTLLGGEYTIVYSDVKDRTVKVILGLDPVICLSRVEEMYKCVVSFEDDLPIAVVKSVDIYSKPSTPAELLWTDEIVENKNSRWDIRPKCLAAVGYVGEYMAGGYIQIWSDYTGTWSEVGAGLIAVDKNDTTEIQSCNKQQTITFRLVSVSMRLHRSHIRCMVVPHHKFGDIEPLHSNTETIKVVPSAQCEGKGKEIIAHPYTCELHIKCDISETPEVLLAIGRDCNSNYCYDTGDYQCKFCSYCGITDLYVEGGHSAVNENSTLNMTCLAEGFNSVANITISHGGSPIATLAQGLIDGDNVFAILDSDYEGRELRVALTSAHCAHEGVYTCNVMGEGRMKEDSIVIDVTGC